MLPLVGRIAADIARIRARLVELGPEQARLDRDRRNLNWTGRSRRYSIQDEVVQLEKNFQEALTELTGLGVALLDAATGLVGFPTIVNDRKAYFSWKPGEEGLTFWNYADDLHRQPVPESWTRPAQETGGKGRARPKK
jgi:hypothetical protein